MGVDRQRIREEFLIIHIPEQAGGTTLAARMKLESNIHALIGFERCRELCWLVTRRVNAGGHLSIIDVFLPGERCCRR